MVSEKTSLENQQNWFSKPRYRAALSTTPRGSSEHSAPHPVSAASSQRHTPCQQRALSTTPQQLQPALRQHSGSLGSAVKVCVCIPQLHTRPVYASPLCRPHGTPNEAQVQRPGISCRSYRRPLPDTSASHVLQPSHVLQIDGQRYLMHAASSAVVGLMGSALFYQTPDQ